MYCYCIKTEFIDYYVGVSDDSDNGHTCGKGVSFSCKEE